MQLIHNKMDCKANATYKNSKRVSAFQYVKYVFNYQADNQDKTILDSLIEKGKVLASSVNKGAANNSSYSRSNARVLNNCIAGVLAEYVWKNFLNENGEIVSETPLENVRNQIDLKIISNSKTIEVRSSFPRNGIEFAICHPIYQFDIIGPYDNTYKPNEIQKDFYVRTLFPFESNLILAKLKKNSFEVYLTGGATWAMMSDDNVSIVKSFIPEDEISTDRLSTKSNYRVVPYCKALDTLQITEYIKQS
jgi:hypothetical protein